jgi:hypothetical protein
MATATESAAEACEYELDAAASARDMSAETATLESSVAGFAQPPGGWCCRCCSARVVVAEAGGDAMLCKRSSSDARVAVGEVMGDEEAESR